MRLFSIRPPRSGQRVPQPRPYAGQAHDAYDGRCPVCSAMLGRHEPARSRTGRFEVPPSMRVEIGHRGSRATWRIEQLAGWYAPMVSTDPPFSEHEIDYSHQLCGEGHVFPDPTPVLRRDGRTQDPASEGVDAWNLVAAIGASASGKTYLLVRTLHQRLSSGRSWQHDNPHRVRVRSLTPLEALPLEARAQEYREMLADRKFMAPTRNIDDSTPYGLLEKRFPGMLGHIREMLVRTVVDGRWRAEEEWGREFRQPMVYRTDGHNRRQWTGIADLPGEMFINDTAGAGGLSAGLWERSRLRDFNALVWAMDPVITANADGWLPSADGNGSGPDRTVLDGSLRPGMIASVGLDKLIANRHQVQSHIGRQLTLAGSEYTSAEGEPLRMLIAITKCDLIRAALRRFRVLEDLGPRDTVVAGTADYLGVTARRWVDGYNWVDEGCEQFLSLVDPRRYTRTDYRKRLLSVAAWLLRTYSTESAFWNLVHVGEDQNIEMGPGWWVTVPSIDDHLDAALQPSPRRQLLLRDLIMSAVGCGVAYGIGHGGVVSDLLDQSSCDVRVFLCSPLGTVPHAVAASLEPLDGNERFPDLGERSAALTQLLLGMLGKVHSHDGG